MSHCLNASWSRFGTLLIGALLGCLLLIADASLGVENFMATSGHDSHVGSIGSPFASQERAQQAGTTGNTVEISGGTYRLTAGQDATANAVLFNNNATEAVRIRYGAYGDERPTFDFTNHPPIQRIRDFSLLVGRLNFLGLDLCGVQQAILDFNESWAIYVENNGDHNIFEQLNLQHNQRPGSFIADDGYNLVFNSDSSRNHGTARGNQNAEGNCKNSNGSDNAFNGIRVWNNDNDGALPILRFSRLASSSSLMGSGMLLDRPCSGSARDLDGFESSMLQPNEMSILFPSLLLASIRRFRSAPCQCRKSKTMEKTSAVQKLESRSSGFIFVHALSIILVVSKRQKRVLSICAVCLMLGNASAEPLRFDFGSGPVADGFVQVLPDDYYSHQRGYGFEPGANMKAVQRPDTRGALDNDACMSDQPFLFSVDLPEGNYQIKVILMAPDVVSVATVKAENRRLMLESLPVEAGQVKEGQFAVNIRTPAIHGGSMVKLNAREIGSKSWDSKLTLEFNGDQPAVAGLEIKSADDLTTIYIAGDSTVTDQPHEPWAGWGQMLPRFFGPDVSIANYAESGRSLRSFKAEGRLDKILSCIQPGDYLLIQFGHNDMKEKGQGIGPYESYSDLLIEYIDAARQKGATPVLITPMHRRWFGEDDKITNTFGDYPDAMRKVAKKTDTPLIDLMEMSKAFYDALGKAGSEAAFVHYHPNTFPGQSERLKDNTHHNAYGAYQLARSVVKGIKVSALDISDKLRSDVAEFDPSHPPVPDSFDWPLSPFPIETDKPLGD